MTRLVSYILFSLFIAASLGACSVTKTTATATATRDTVDSTATATKESLKKVESSTKSLESSLTGVADYEEAIKSARKRYKTVPTKEICRHATQEIAQNWALFQANRDFIAANQPDGLTQEFFRKYARSAIDSVGRIIPIPFTDDLFQDQLAFAANQLGTNIANMSHWTNVYKNICRN